MITATRGVLRIPVRVQVQAVGLLCEGNSVRGTARLLGISKNTVCALVLKIGEACQAYQDFKHQGLPCKRVEADELWSFIRVKEQRVKDDTRHMTASEKNRRAKARAKAMSRGEEVGPLGSLDASQGDHWTYLGFCSDSKFLIHHFSGRRNNQNTQRFLTDLASRIAVAPTLVTDHYKGYRDAVQAAYRGREVHYAQIQKVYAPHKNRMHPYVETVEAQEVFGCPDLARASTCGVERFNLFLRQNVRRFHRETQAHSKSAKHHAAMIAIYAQFYNYCRVHGRLRETPAQALGVAGSRWSLARLVDLLFWDSTHDARWQEKWDKM